MPRQRRNAPRLAAESLERRDAPAALVSQIGSAEPADSNAGRSVPAHVARPSAGDGFTPAPLKMAPA